MAKKSTIAFAEKTLTPEQFAAWQAMPVKLSKSQLKAGEVPPLVGEPEEKQEQPEALERAPATAEQLKAARDEYVDDDHDIEIDDDALTSVGDDGVVWIQAWVLLPTDDEETDSEEESEDEQS